MTTFAVCTEKLIVFVFIGTVTSCSALRTSQLTAAHLRFGHVQIAGIGNVSNSECMHAHEVLHSRFRSSEEMVQLKVSIRCIV